uniref:Replication-associated protein n=1 Tax=Tarsiger cyanurus Genomoviridae sp. TaxID=2814994 RepID=A0A8A4XBZ4_9VIRU
MPTRNFHFHARYALLTYAQCGTLDAQRIVERITELAGQCVIGREHHADGGIHYHCFVDFGRKFRSRKTDVFDVGGKHPNSEQSRGTPEKGWDYAVKDGDIVHSGLPRPAPKVRSGVSASDSKWHTITASETRDEFWKLCHELDPKAAAVNFSSLQKYCDWKFAPIIAAYESPTGVGFIGGETDGRDDWLLQSGIGSEIPLIDECMKATEVDYAVFDDLRGGIKFFPSFKEWLGCQAWVTVKCLYREPKLVKWGKPTIYLANTDPRDEMTNADIEWMNKNCIFVEINSPIFHANT